MLYTMLFLILVTAWLVCGGENNGQSASAWWQSLTQADCSCRAHKDAFDLKVTKSPQTKAINVCWEGHITNLKLLCVFINKKKICYMKLV